MKATLVMFPDPMFTLFFIFFFVIVAVSIVLSILRVMKGTRRGEWSSTSEVEPVREREIIREVVKVRCSYCGNLYDETEDKCPHCGGKKL